MKLTGAEYVKQLIPSSATTVADAAVAAANQVPLGIAYMVGSTAMFAGGNAVVK